MTRLANIVYIFHLVVLILLLVGFLLPIPLFWVISVTVILTCVVCFEITGGCALSRYEYYFLGKKGKNKFIKRVLEEFGVKPPSKILLGILYIILTFLYILRIYKSFNSSSSSLNLKNMGITSLVTLICIAIFCFSAPKNNSATNVKN